MKYQDSWRGGLVEKGVRECANRYEVVKDFCKKLDQPFTVCDIGSNMNYFGIRLIEDFDCTVVSFDFHQFEMRERLVKKNKKMMFLKRKLSLHDLKILSSVCKFDLVLVMSVMHHLLGDQKEWINGFKDMGKNVIIEYALSDSKRVNDFKLPDGRIIGYGDSHLKKNFKRPIILLNQ